jgi:hypothetical protein
MLVGLPLGPQKLLFSARTAVIKNNCTLIMDSEVYRSLVLVISRKTQVWINKTASSILMPLLQTSASILISSHWSCKKHLSWFLQERCPGLSCLLVTDISLIRWHQVTEWRLWVCLVFLIGEYRQEMPISRSSKARVFKFLTSESSE